MVPSEDIFDAWEAQKWWLENSERISDLYDIRRPPPFRTPPPSEVDGLVISPNDSPIGSCRTQSQESIEVQRSNGSLRTLMPGVLTGESSADGSTTMSNGDSQGDVIEWVQEYESGVFVTVRSYPDGTRELRRVELSRDRFGEVKARVWWEENKERLHREYS
ncbi:Protein Brevis radix-like 3 [Acorus calamus]|uniref:Protein Brevis radix-like 3 n=1 Tax=Acorus calamus TaxID=4465 RepID=A0AAV9D5L8_ACOCL|nr:Protein Brevis radix-like 3 [Acorus calamus]